MQTGTDPPVNRMAEETFRITRTAETILERTRAVAVSAINNDRAILGIAIIAIVRSMLASSSKVADGTTNAPEGTMEALSRMVLELELRRRK